MAKQLFANNAASEVIAPLTIAGVSLVLSTGTGTRFPTPTGGDYFMLTLFEHDEGGDEVNIEVVKCTARTTDTLTIERDAEGIVGVVGGRAYPSAPGTTVFAELRWTQAGAEGMLQKVDNLASLANAATARTNLSLGNVDNISDANKPVSTLQAAAIALKAPIASPTFTGNLSFSGTGNRIIGDFSNATLSNRTLLQNRVVDATTNIGAIPNGAGTVATFQAIGTSDPTNASVASLAQIGTTESRLSASAFGTGTYSPMTFYTGGAERLKIDTSGNINIPTLGARITGDFSNATLANRVMFQSSTSNNYTTVDAIPNGTGTLSEFAAYTESDPTNASFVSIRATTGVSGSVISSKAGTGTYLPMTFHTGGAERLRIDTSGNVLVTNAAGLGYGTGAGGTVTQATSKSTSVDLHKPCGKITMHNAALGAGVSASFIVNNSLVNAVDLVILNSPAYGLSYRIECSSIATGLFYVRVTNITGGSLSEALVLNFAIIKGTLS